jgi:8-oxo-dGTP diphosphatase
MSEARRRVVVIAALITGRGGRVLIAQRRPDQAHPLGWELPGGKLEPGESPAQALAREMREELDIDVEVGRIWDVLHHPYPDFDLLMLVYHARILDGGAPRCREVNDVAWALPEELSGYPILAADRPLIARLEAEGVPLNPHFD